MFGIAEKGQSRHLLLDPNVDLIAGGADSVAGAACGDTGFQRQNLFQQRRCGGVRQVRSPLDRDY